MSGIVKFVREALDFIGIPKGVSDILLFAFPTFTIGNAAVAAVAQSFKKPKQPNFPAEAENRTRMVRQAVTSRKLVYGEIKLSGQIIHKIKQLF